MPNAVAQLLNASWFATAARVVVTFPYWSSGLSKTFGFGDALAEMARYDLHPPVFFAIATIVCMFVGSALVIANRHVWLGAGALIVFTALTIPIAHDFWNLTGPAAQTELFFVVEHIGLIGGLMLAAILAQRGKAQNQEA